MAFLGSQSCSLWTATTIGGEFQIIIYDIVPWAASLTRNSGNVSSSIELRDWLYRASKLDDYL